MRRRDMLVWGGVAAVAISIPPVLRRLDKELVFEPIAGQPGFRKLVHGSTTAVQPVFLGLTTTQENAASASLPDDLRPLLYRGLSLEDARIPVVAFSDYFCPYCAELDRRLIRLRDAGAPIALRFQPLPVLGERSRTLTRIAFAAGRQSNFEPIHVDLMHRGLRPGPSALSAFAERHGLDADQLKTDAASRKTDRDVQIALALGRAMGVFATPGTLIGRTLVIGAMDDRMIERLLSLESARPRAFA